MGNKCCIFFYCSFYFILFYMKPDQRRVCTHCVVDNLRQMKMKEAKLTTRNMSTEYCQPAGRSVDIIIGKQTPEQSHYH